MKQIRLKDCVNLYSNLDIKKKKYVALEDISSWSGLAFPKIIDEFNDPETWKTIKKGSINFCKLRPYLAKAFIAEEDLIGTGELISFNAKKNIYSKFLLYFILNKEFIFNVNESCYGSKMPRLNWDILGCQIIPNISLTKQKSITKYLEYHTPKLDKEIYLLEQKVEKLDEYKQALIYETVTNGLDKNVPIKDSEIEWIGMIPAHWKVKRVKEFSVWQNGFTPDTKKTEYYEGNDDWITIRDMDGKYINESKNKINGSLFPKHWITPANSLLFSFKLSIGQVAFNKKEVFTNEAICSFSPKSKINLKYFYYAAPVFIVKNAKKNIYDADLLNQDLIANAICVVPPKSEQLAIANYLDEECLKIDKEKELINKKIELLKEYKQALIYEAVTGKMDIKEEL